MVSEPLTIFVADHQEEPFPQGVGHRWIAKKYVGLSHNPGWSCVILIVVTRPAFLPPV